MCRWVYLAGTQRIKHLALMRASAASREFALFHVTLLAMALGLFQLTVSGWKWVTVSPAVEASGSVLPSGKGWLHAAAAPRPLPPGHPVEEPADLWWNAGHAALGFAAGLILAWILLRLVLVAIRAGVTKAHTPDLRPEERMTAAVHYGTAWFLPLVTACLISLLYIPAQISSLAEWSAQLPAAAVTVVAGVVTAAGLFAWWFWLVRLASAAPPRSRGRVMAFMMFGVPLIAALAAAAWWSALHFGLPPLFRAMNLTF